MIFTKMLPIFGLAAIAIGGAEETASAAPPPEPTLEQYTTAKPTAARLEAGAGVLDATTSDARFGGLIPGLPGIPGIPGLPGLPGIPGLPNIFPEIPGLPNIIPGIPGIGRRRAGFDGLIPGLPGTPGNPGLPNTFPEIPGLPNIFPGIPGLPNIFPEIPGLPNILPGIPGIGRRRSAAVCDPQKLKSAITKGILWGGKMNLYGPCTKMGEYLESAFDANGNMKGEPDVPLICRCVGGFDEKWAQENLQCSMAGVNGMDFWKGCQSGAGRRRQAGGAKLENPALRGFGDNLLKSPTLEHSAAAGPAAGVGFGAGGGLINLLDPFGILRGIIGATGRRRGEVDANLGSLFPGPTPMFDIGACNHLELTNEGRCVATKPSGSDMECEITALGAFTLEVRKWEVDADMLENWKKAEVCSYNYIELNRTGEEFWGNGERFCNKEPQGEPVSRNEKMFWRTNTFTTKHRWEICAGSPAPGGSQEMNALTAMSTRGSGFGAGGGLMNLLDPLGILRGIIGSAGRRRVDLFANLDGYDTTQGDLFPVPAVGEDGNLDSALSHGGGVQTGAFVGGSLLNLLDPFGLLKLLNGRRRLNVNPCFTHPMPPAQIMECLESQLLN